jgi:alkylation response protein AidB-like acyl-CoA dehydrogenase
MSSVYDWPASPKAELGISGAEPQLSDLAAGIQQNLREFATNVMRPTGAELDRMSPAEVIGEGSPLWRFRKQYLELGINLEALSNLSAQELGLVFPIIFEELGYGDAGLAIHCAAAILPQYLAVKFQNTFLIERFPDTMIGCWGITEPDHGSDSLDPGRQIFHAEGQYGRPNCVGTITGDEITISGQKSAWISNGSIAEVCILYCAADTGNGPDPENGVCVLVPMDAEGVSRGRPLDKLGQRALDQTEIYFDNVKLSAAYILAGADNFQRAVHCIHCEANALMGSVFTGLGQAAFDLAHEYVHERRQGGVPIIRHQSVAHRLFHMYRKVEASRAISRRAYMYNASAPVPSIQTAIAAKITSTQFCYEVTSDALQLFGGYGLSREYPVEKMLRDARASLIEDGCNEILAIKAGYCFMSKEETSDLIVE